MLLFYNIFPHSFLTVFIFLLLIFHSFHLFFLLPSVVTSCLFPGLPPVCFLFCNIHTLLFFYQSSALLSFVRLFFLHFISLSLPLSLFPLFILFQSDALLSIIMFVFIAACTSCCFYSLSVPVLSFLSISHYSLLSSIILAIFFILPICFVPLPPLLSLPSAADSFPHPCISFHPLSLSRTFLSRIPNPF